MRQLLILLLLIGNVCIAQKGYLLVKKNGRKVRTFPERTVITIQTDRSGVRQGYINIAKNDSIFIGGVGFHQSEIKKIILRQSKKLSLKIDPKLIALITLGVGLSTAGMTLSKYETFSTALTYSATLGYSPILISTIRNKISFSRKKYKIGKKFTVQVLDFYF